MHDKSDNKADRRKGRLEHARNRAHHNLELARDSFNLAPAPAYGGDQLAPTARDLLNSLRALSVFLEMEPASGLKLLVQSLAFPPWKNVVHVENGAARTVVSISTHAGFWWRAAEHADDLEAVLAAFLIRRRRPAGHLDEREQHKLKKHRSAVYDDAQREFEGWLADQPDEQVIDFKAPPTPPDELYADLKARKELQQWLVGRQRRRWLTAERRREAHQHLRQIKQHRVRQRLIGALKEMQHRRVQDALSRPAEQCAASVLRQVLAEARADSPQNSTSQ